MASLQLNDLLALLDGGAATVTAPADVAASVAYHAARVWSDCRLIGTPPPTIEYCAFARDGAKYLCRFNAGRKKAAFSSWSARRPLEYRRRTSSSTSGQYRAIMYTDFATGFVGEPTEQMLADSLLHLREGNTPAAILESGEGTYLQTYQDGPRWNTSW